MSDFLIFGWVSKMSTREAERLIRQRMTSRGMSTHAIELFLSQIVEISNDASRKSYDLKNLYAPDSSLLVETPSDEESMRELEKRGQKLLGSAVIVKLNGGRSTTMGGNVPKGILVAKNGLSYLDIICLQIGSIRKKYGVDIPLLLMNSFFTDALTHEVLIQNSFPALSFVQKEVPRLLEDSLFPLETGTDDDWAPPGHGDIYDSLQETGSLDQLLSQGVEWAFISNVDNLAATLDPWILGLMEAQSIDFLLEVTDRTDEDRKGGTLVVNEDRLELLEIGQVPDDQLDLFMDIKKFRVFNTNNVWVNLRSLKELLATKSIKLPIIENRKKIRGHNIVQLETAMGSALGSFKNTRGLRVGRDRFFPTKKIEDLFVLQSDACIIDEDVKIKPNPKRSPTLPLRPQVSFSSDFIDSPLRIPEKFSDWGSISMVDAVSLKVSGPVYFEQDINIKGTVVIKALTNSRCVIPKGSVLKDTELTFE